MRPLTLELLATPKAVPDVRRTVREHVGAPCADLQLCVSELITNVIRHLGEGVPITVRLARVQGRTRLEVTDPDPRAWPVLCRAAADDETGRGLALLGALTLRWGVDQGQGAGTKTIWCELPGDDGPVPRGVLRAAVHPLQIHEDDLTPVGRGMPEPFEGPGLLGVWLGEVHL
ncbi:ATP-binding protein [Streptomyces sp. NPDC059909]|uniref:ATP-binding protein n=1 Tax=Streptomyces sp. NPDC059909 TaxID=3346998 RepID=UPI00365E4791